MAAYPSLPTVLGSDPVIESGITVRRATNGALKLRADQPVDKASFGLTHRLTPAEWTTLQAFYAANKWLNVDYTYPGSNAAYTVRFAGAPQPRYLGGAVEVRVTLLEV
ncbi:MAG: hypothetical protein RR101_13500 [Burkholderiaceae bacterium]